MPYQSSAWVDSICASGNFEDASRLYVSVSGEPLLVLPLVRRHYLSNALSMQLSMPYGWGMGGVLTAHPLTVEDIRFVLADLASLHSLSVSIRPNPLLGELWAAAKTPGIVGIPRMAHVLDLEGGVDAVWTKRFSSDTRNKLRRAQRRNIDVEHDTTGRLIPVFYDLLRLSFERWARQQHEPLSLAHLRNKARDPLRKFETIARHLGTSCHIWVAREQGEPIAAILVLMGTNTNYSRGAMNKALVGNSWANELLHWLAIQESCSNGAHHYHFGETGSSALLAQFKSKFGAAAFPYEEYRLDRVPITKIDHTLRRAVKRLIGFKD